MTVRPTTTIVIPTIGRASLGRLVRALASQDVPLDAPVILVDDRPDPTPPLDPATLDPAGELTLTVVRSGGGGPARARNFGWRRAGTRWVAFLDDDVVPCPDWSCMLHRDLAAADAQGRLASEGQVVVPAPQGRRPTDTERRTLGLDDAQWITADMAVRRAVLAAAGGFDERFRRAYREDSDLALRIGAEHGTIARGVRCTVHPLPEGDGLASSLRAQRGNADDQLMRRLHGRQWRQRARAPRGRLRRHALVTAAELVGLAGALTGRRLLAAAGAAGWLAGTAELARSRIAPGPRDPREVARMLATSALIPSLAVGYAALGRLRHAHAGPWRGLPDAVLFDRDGTLVHDVPYNGDPDRVRPVDQAASTLARLRDAGIRVAVVSNQSGIGSGRLRPEQVRAVNDRVERLLGPFDGIYVCPHAREAGCDCRKPRPGLISRACEELGVPAERTVVIGDIGSDVDAATAAGAHGVLVPTAATRPREIGAAPRVSPDLEHAVSSILGGRW